MALQQVNPTQTPAWKKLEEHFQKMKSSNMNDWFAADPNRSKDFQIKWNNFLVDYSKNLMTEETLDLLLELAEDCGLKEAVNKQFSGDEINETEGRKVLHTALRSQNKPDEVGETLARMKEFSDKVIGGKWRGYSNLPITDVVNIGIGGSDLGPRMVADALAFYKTRLNVHFLSNVDGDQVAELLDKLNPETTLFIVVSKSFTTQETLTNAKIVRKWFFRATPKKSMVYHFVTVSTNLEEVRKFGILKKNIFPMWDWVGGRFSLWSAVGLSVCMAIGYDNFSKLLNGARLMDEHFRDAEARNNIPVILGMLSVWYNNFYQTQAEAVVPYTFYLERLVPYLQQAVMESNGKSVSRSGEPISYQTGNIVWGSTGTNAQHAFFQLLHQGTKLIPCDFIGFKQSLYDNKKSHDKLMSNFFAQTQALLTGKTKEEVLNELKDMPEAKRNRLLPFKIFEGNKPTNTILIDKLTPESLGSLIALYEHKIFVQGVIWNIFSYDQWGVELGKQLATRIEQEFNSEELPADWDSSTSELVKNYLDN